MCPRQHLPPQLIGSEEYAKNSLLPSLVVSLTRHFFLLCQLLLLLQGLLPLPYSFSGLLPPEALMRLREAEARTIAQKGYQVSEFLLCR